MHRASRRRSRRPSRRPPHPGATLSDVAYLVWGTALDAGESATDERVRAAAGPAVMQTLHGAYEVYGQDSVAILPGGPEWLAVVQAAPESKQHFAVHGGHLLLLNEADNAE